MERWSGKVAVVTGASAGIGLNLTEALASEGVKVVGLARRAELLDELTRKYPGCVHPLKCDLQNEVDILEAFKYVEDKLGPVHVLVNNAGFLSSETIIDGKTETYRKILDINVLAPAICIREATRSMLKHKVQGHIINVNSVLGHAAESYRLPASLYCASKYALNGLTISVRHELAKLDCGIKITSVSPGAVRTQMPVSAGFSESALAKTPSSMILEPNDVTKAILYALSTPPHVQVKELTVTAVDQSLSQK